MWPPGSLVPDDRGKARVTVEAKAGVAQGPFSLMLWEEEGLRRKIVIDKVTFP